MNLSLTQNNRLLQEQPANAITSRTTGTILTMLVCMAAFEIINFAITSLAFRSLLSRYTVLVLDSATWLATVVCCVDIIGILYLFLLFPGPSHNIVKRRLFSVWLLVTGLNSWLLWLGIGQAIVVHQAQTDLVINAGIMVHIIPAFIVCLVWLIRILLIGSFSRPQEIIDVSITSENSLIFPEGTTQLQSFLPFDLLPHGTENQYGPIQINGPGSTNMREPTYRGIPVRYRTS